MGRDNLDGDRKVDALAAGSLTRRQLLAGAGAGGIALLAGGSWGCTTTDPTATPGTSFFEPKVLASQGGRLDVELVAAPGTVDFGGGTRWAFTYNGTSPGPTLVARPGDVINLTLVNRLDEPTNVHTHGLHVSPASPGDNPFVTVAPGARHIYRYEIPADHRSGVFWYHPHHHGRVARQVSGGMAGALIIEDGLDRLPVIAGAATRVLILSDPTLGDSAATLDVPMMSFHAGREGNAVLVNGRQAPRIPARAGTWERWRIVNASASRYYDLALDGHQFTVVAGDGGRLARPVTASSLRLVPGERAEVLVPVSKPGSFRLVTRPVARGSMMMMGTITSTAGGPLTIATVEVSGAATPPSAAPASLTTLTDLRTVPVSATREVTLSMMMDEMGMGGMHGGGAGTTDTTAGNGGMGMGGMHGGGMGGMHGNDGGSGMGGMHGNDGGSGMGGMHGNDGGSGMGGMMDGMFLIDGRPYGHGRVDITASLGTVEDWVVRNTSDMDHPFHLHTWSFQVMERSNGTPEPGWKDTINVPANGWVRIRIPFRDYGGRTVYHCHILDHEDLGMMGTIEVS